MQPDRTALDDPSLCPPDAVARTLGTDLARGLRTDEAARRRARDGPNTLRATPRPRLWTRALAQIADPLVLLLLVAAAIATGVWALDGRHGWPIDAVVIGLVVVLNAVLGLLQEAKADHAVAALARMTAVTSSVLRDGRIQRIPSADLVRGDLLLLAEGDAVGADARLVEAAALHVQEAPLTGESAAVLKDTATLPEAVSLGDRLCMVYKGTAVVQGSGRALVTATGMDTEMGAIATLLDATTAAPTPLQQEVARISRTLGLAAAVIAVTVVGTVLAMSATRTPADLVGMLLLGVSLAVAVVPEGLPAILSVVLAMGVQRMAGRQAIVKTLAAVETLGSASVIASDKTGTLTRAEMTIVRVITASGSTQVTGVGYAPDGRVEHQGSALAAGPLRAEHIVVLSGGSLAGNADLRQTAEGAWEIQGDPTEAAFLVAERKLGAHTRRRTRFARIAELPFTSDRKMMSTIARDHDHGDERVLIAKGAPDVLLGHCTRARVGLETVPLDGAGRQRILADIAALSDAALRTLAVAYRPLGPDEDPAATNEALERELVYVGTVGIIDPPRPEAAVAIRQAQGAGIRVLMITGDHPRTAVRIATDLGIVAAGAPVLTGTDLDALDGPALADAVRRTSVYARVAPRHKLRIVAALQADGNVVAMTGDGVNDAPALKAADIGIAMGRTGTEVTKDAARMILADDNFATIVHAVREGRGVLDNIRKFLRYLLSSNLGEVLTVFLGIAGAGWLGLQGEGGAVAVPLLATQILWINLITDAGPALAMGVDPVTEDVMARRPRPPTERVIDGRLWAGVVEIGVVMALLTLGTLDLFLPGGWIAGTQSLEQARTAAFTVLVLAQLFNCFNARSDTASAWHGLFSNRWLWGAVALSALLQVAVVELGTLNLAFGTVPLPVAQWGVCVVIASGVLWFSELRKGLRRARPGRMPAETCA